MTQTETELKYWNAFGLIREIGPVRFKKLINYFPSMEQAYKADEQELGNAELDQKTIEAILIKRRETDIEQEYEKLCRENIKIVTIKDVDYPKSLKEIYAAPAILYVKGNLKNDEKCLAIVGTRKYSLYGKQATLEITDALCKIGITVVSGLARGIDTFAHQACLNNNSQTIAVAGSGIDNASLYPSANRELARRIKEQGAVISEYPIGTLPLKQNFPARNRIISGLCLGTLVVEAPESSGALITAKYALEQNREVFAVPGPIYSVNSAGTNHLIKSGAKLVTNIEDIVEELNLAAHTAVILPPTEKKEIKADNIEEKTLLNLLNNEPTHIDFLIQESQLPTSQINSLLVMLEINGRIRNLGGMNYILIR